MLRFFYFLLILLSCCYLSSAYFTLPGKCPEHLPLQNNFTISDLHSKWHQVYHYSSDGQSLANCSTMQAQWHTIGSYHGIYLNISRVDRGLFHRFSLGKVELPPGHVDHSTMKVAFQFKDAPRKLMTRNYLMHVLAFHGDVTSQENFATLYTCQYSSLIDKHYIYVWILSKTPTLNETSIKLAVEPLEQIGITEDKLVKDDLDNCLPKYFEDEATEPVTFRTAVPI